MSFSENDTGDYLLMSGTVYLSIWMKVKIYLILNKLLK